MKKKSALESLAVSSLTSTYLMNSKKRETKGEMLQKKVSRPKVLRMRYQLKFCNQAWNGVEGKPGDTAIVWLNLRVETD